MNFFDFKYSLQSLHIGVMLYKVAPGSEAQEGFKNQKW